MISRSEAAVQVPSRDIHVLHVDDDRAFAELSVEMLEREEDDINAIAETRPREAVDRVVDENIDCIVSDYEMPEMDGIELLQTIRERHPDLPFILFTGKGSEEVASEAFSVGASDYLRKEHGTDQYTLLANRIVSAIENVRSQQKQRRQLRAIETAKEGIAIFNPEGCCTYANQRYADIYGYNPEQLLDKHWEEFYPPEEADYVRKEIMSILDEEGYWHGRMTNVGSDGIPFEIDHSVATTEEGGMVCTIREISNHDDVERELTKFKTIVETLNDPVYVCDDDGRFQYVNSAFLDLVGYSRDRVIGAYPGLVKSEKSVEVAEDNLVHLLSSENADSVVFEVEIQPKDSEPIPCEDHMGALVYEGDGFSGSVGVLRDVSARKARARELERQNRRLDEFASIVSHDLRNPLSIGRGQLELAQEDCESEHLEEVEKAHTRMETLIEDMLTYARDGTRVENLEQVTVADLSRSCWDDAADGSATLTADVDKTILADKSRLRQLLENLFRNAVEYGGDNVHVRVGALPDGFYVADDGPGIPAGEREDVFDPGYSSLENGTGFGLAIVREIATAHDWTIEVTESQAGGARFEITDGQERVEEHDATAHGDLRVR